VTFASALLVAALYGGTEAGTLAACGSCHADSLGGRQATSGVIIAADVEGRLAIYDAAHRLVVELEKPGGRPLQIALEPGAYEAWLGGHPSRRARFHLGEGQQPLLLTPADFLKHDAWSEGSDARDHARSAAGDHAHPAGQPRDGRHRIEVRFGGWSDGWYDGHGAAWEGSGTVHGAFGLEYLHLVRSDLAIGIGVSGLVRVVDEGRGWEDGGAAQATCGIPVVARWYPVRRLTTTRFVEPYVAAGIGPVFGVDTVYADGFTPWGGPWDWDDEERSSTRVGTTIGGRLGGGVDFRLGSVFTLGVSAAWNWDGFSNGQWWGPRPGGGEFDVVLGWMFGR